MSQAKERRVAPRSKRGIRVVSDSESIIKHIDNISSSGVLCHATQPIPEMTKLEVFLELPAPINQRVSAEVLVVRCVAEEPKHDEFKLAILYTKVGEDDLKAIRTYVEQDLNAH